jgi:hypothetical protein
MVWVLAMIPCFRPGTSLLLVAALAAGGCRPAEPEHNQSSNAVQQSAEPRTLSVRTPPVDRAALLGFVARAGSDAAAGIDDSASQGKLDGRPFEIRIRFGCAGPAEKLDETALGWSFSAEDRTLRVRAVPTLTDAKGVVPRIAGRPVEAVEGFLIARPWLLQPVCPKAPAPTDEAAGGETDEAAAPLEPAASPEEPSEARIGIAEFYTAADSRTERRRDRPFQAVVKLDEGAAAPTQGFNLVLAGRLRALTGRKVIYCLARGVDRAPSCIVSARFDRVWIERPQSGEVIAEWRTG